jgi:hypothetical protein
LKKLGTFIQDLKGMLDDFAFLHFPKIEVLFFDHHFGAGHSLSRSRRGKKSHQEQRDEQAEPFLHGNLLGRGAFLELPSKDGGDVPHCSRQNRTGPRHPQEIVVKTLKVYHDVEKTDKRIVMTAPLEVL